ncbi:hypothetical protein AMK59_4081, partial [Oryctes borbonicus]
RALLTAENLEQAHKIIRDSGTGAADGCSINMTLLNTDGGRIFHNVEMAPAYGNQDESTVDLEMYEPGQNMIHCNKYLRINIPETPSFMLDSSVMRLKVLRAYPEPSGKEDVKKMLGDESEPVYKVFREAGKEDKIKTIAIGIFDFIKKTWELYSDNPAHNEPLVVLPLELKNQ